MPINGKFVGINQHKTKTKTEEETMLHCIYKITQNGGIVAGQRKTLCIHVPGGIITITDPAEIAMIEAWKREAGRWTNATENQINDYLVYMINENGIL